MVYRSEGTEKMTYAEFRQIIKEELTKVHSGLTWTQIRKRRPEIYQRFPANQWVRRMEKDIGLIRSKEKGKTLWRLG